MMNTANNLDIAADYIEQHVPQDKLIMLHFRSTGETPSKSVVFRGLHDCGTAGCVLGWAPFAPGLEPIDSDYHDRNNTLKWHEYSDRVFPELPLGRLWMSVFSSRLSSDKAQCVARLRRKAAELRARQGE